MNLDVSADGSVLPDVCFVERPFARTALIDGLNYSAISHRRGLARSLIAPDPRGGGPVGERSPCARMSSLTYRARLIFGGSTREAEGIDNYLSGRRVYGSSIRSLTEGARQESESQEG